MVDTELVEDRGAEVADRDFIFNDIIGVVVCFAVSGSALDSTSSHPGGEAFRVVIAAVVVARELALAIGSTAEFACKDDESIIEHASLLEIIDESGAGLIDVVSLASYFFGKPNVVVPTPVEELYEADSTFCHATGEKAVSGERAGFLDFWTVEFFVNLFIFLCEVGEVRNRGLHTESHFLLSDGSLDFRVANFGHLLFVKFGDKVEHLTSSFWGDIGGVREKENRIARGLERNALML